MQACLQAPRFAPERSKIWLGASGHVCARVHTCGFVDQVCYDAGFDTPQKDILRRSVSASGQFARVVRGVDLRSTTGNCAWARSPQLTNYGIAS